RESRGPAIANGSCMGRAMFGAVAAGRRGGGYDTIEEAVRAMGPPVGKTYIPNQSAAVVYDALFEMYKEMYLYLGKESSILKQLAFMRGKEEGTV
ncbi:MAG: ribulokinase, partial [Clostridia bacterium]|nr:ribulokinase [Clostridia bacterium]